MHPRTIYLKTSTTSQPSTNDYSTALTFALDFLRVALAFATTGWLEYGLDVAEEPRQSSRQAAAHAEAVNPRAR